MCSTRRASGHQGRSGGRRMLVPQVIENETRALRTQLSMEYCIMENGKLWFNGGLKGFNQQNGVLMEYYP